MRLSKMDIPSVVERARRMLLVHYPECTCDPEVVVEAPGYITVIMEPGCQARCPQ